jgi:hypothetical protein
MDVYICQICGIYSESAVENMVNEGWVPAYWDGEVMADGPICPSCTQVYLEVDDDGEIAAKNYPGMLWCDRS